MTQKSPQSIFSWIFQWPPPFFIVNRLSDLCRMSQFSKMWLIPTFMEPKHPLIPLFLFIFDIFSMIAITASLDFPQTCLKSRFYIICNFFQMRLVRLPNILLPLSEFLSLNLITVDDASNLVLNEENFGIVLRHEVIFILRKIAVRVFDRRESFGSLGQFLAVQCEAHLLWEVPSCPSNTRDVNSSQCHRIQIGLTDCTS